MEDALFIALGESLGYSKNKNAMRQLLWHCPASSLRQHLRADLLPRFETWTYLLLRSGLDELLLRPSAASGSDSYRRWLSQREYWRSMGHLPLMEPADWHFSRLRPFNSPAIRLATLNEIWHRYSSGNFFSTLLTIARQRLSPIRLLREWRQCLRFPFDGCFTAQLGEVLRLQRMPVHILGEQRLRQFCISGLLPALYHWACHSHNEGFRIYLEQVYESFPATESPALFKRTFSGAGRKRFKALACSGYLQQGYLEWLAMQAARSGLLEPESAKKKA
jgi:hypothetical protein